jgi:hypothetical protein
MEEISLIMKTITEEKELSKWPTLN